MLPVSGPGKHTRVVAEAQLRKLAGGVGLGTKALL